MNNPSKLSGLTREELELIGLLLDLASDHFANHSCNDWSLPEAWSQKQCDQFTLAMDTRNGSEDCNEPGSRLIQDWMAMEYLAARCKEDL